MRRKFAGIVGLVMVLVGSFASTGWTLDRGIYDASNWQDWVGVRIDTIFSDWSGDWRRFGAYYQCFMTARLIIYKVNEVDFNLQCNGKREIDFSHVKGVGSNAGKSVNEIVTLVGQRLGASNEEQVRAEFSKARVGDLVQFCRSSSKSTGEHTVIISGFYDDGIDVLHGGWNKADSIVNQKFTYAQLAGWFEYSDAGFSIYRFGNPIPPGIKISDTFPDALFREYVSYWDTNNDGYFSDDEIENVRDFGWYGGPHPDNEYENAWGGWEPKGVLESRVGTNHWKGIRSIEGVRIFRNLEVLYVHNDSITGAVDISGLTKLKDFRCWNGNNSGGITSINAEGCSALEQIQCRGNKVTSINSNGCGSLTYIDIYHDIAPRFTTEALPDAYIGIPYYAKVDAIGTTTETTPMTYTLNSGVPSANGFDVQNWMIGRCTDGIIKGTSGYINGNPTNRTPPYTVNFPITVSNHKGQASKTFTVTVRETPVAPKLKASALGDAYIGEAYSAQIQATGTTPITYVINSGVPLANGFNLDGGNVGGCINGVIKGTPGYVNGTPTNKTPPYTVSIPITATNAGGSDTRTFTVTVRKRTDPPSITTSSLPKATAGEHYYYILQASGTQPINWSVTNGSLPPGLSLTTDGTISGTVGSGASGTYSFRVTANNSFYDYKNLSITVNVPPSVSTTGLMDGYVNESYSATLTATGTTPITWTASGLPGGLSCSSAGKITGTPTASGTYSVKVTAASSAGNSTKTLTLTIYTLPTISYTFKSGKTGQSYSDYVSVSGGKSSYTWTNDSGTIPAGLSMSPSGSSLYLKGTPSAAKTYTFRLKVRDANGRTATKDFTVTIASSATAPTITTTSLPAGKVGTSYSATLTASGTTITWTATGLPSGLSCSSVGVISGTPTAAGTFSVTVRAENSAGSVSKTLSLTINSSGGGTVTPEAEDEPEFKAYQPVLEGQIIVNFYTLLPEISGVDYNNSYVKFDVLNDTKYNPTQEYDASFSREGKYGTYYGFRCCLTSIQMADPITATLHYGNGRTVTHTYKLTDYLDKYYSASSTPEALRNIVGAMKDYGHYAQIALAEANGWTIGVDHMPTEAATVYTEADVEEARQAVESYAKSWNVGTSGIQSIAYRLVLDSDTALELMLRPASGYSGKVCAYSRGAVGITDTGANLAVKQADGRYLVQISGIPAHKLDFTNTIHVVTDNGEFDAKVSALSYVNTIINSTKYNDNMKKAVTSLYRYYKATKEYRESSGM